MAAPTASGRSGPACIARRTLLGAAVGALSGCSLPGAAWRPSGGGSGAPLPSARASGPASAGSASVAQSLRAALAAGERDAFSALFTDDARTLGMAWFDTWRSFSWFRLRDEGPTRVGVWWRLGDEPLPSATSLELSLADGLIDGVTDPESVPIWLHQRTVLVAAGAVRVLCADPASDARAWADLAATATERVLAAGFRGWHGWDGELVVEIPLDTAAFDDRDGTGTGSGAAAFTTTDEDLAAVIVVDPTLMRDWGDEDRGGVLTHEVVHVAMGPSGGWAPTWVREGLADWVALPYWGWGRSSSKEVLAGVPDDPDLPTDDDFASRARVDEAYALAEVAIAGLVAEYGRDQVLSWALDWTAEDVPAEETIVTLLRAELRRRR